MLALFDICFCKTQPARRQRTLHKRQLPSAGTSTGKKSLSRIRSMNAFLLSSVWRRSSSESLMPSSESSWHTAICCLNLVTRCANLLRIGSATDSHVSPIWARENKGSTWLRERNSLLSYVALHHATTHVLWEDRSGSGPFSISHLPLHMPFKISFSGTRLGKPKLLSSKWRQRTWAP